MKFSISREVDGQKWWWRALKSCLLTFTFSLNGVSYTTEDATFSMLFCKTGCSCATSFPLTVGVRQGGALSPLFFHVYVDSRPIIQHFKMPHLRYRIDWCHFGCIMYADDLMLVVPRLHACITATVNFCVDIATHINIQFHPRKCPVICCGSWYLKCHSITVSETTCFCEQAQNV